MQAPVYVTTGSLTCTENEHININVIGLAETTVKAQINQHLLTVISETSASLWYENGLLCDNLSWSSSEHFLRTKRYR